MPAIATMYVVQTDAIDEETGDDLYWSNTDGHVDLASATVFTEEQRNGMRYIPKGFKIVEVTIKLSKHKISKCRKSK